eukprot:UN4339
MDITQLRPAPDLGGLERATDCTAQPASTTGQTCSSIVCSHYHSLVPVIFNDSQVYPHTLLCARTRTHHRLTRLRTRTAGPENWRLQQTLPHALGKTTDLPTKQRLTPQAQRTT